MTILAVDFASKGRSVSSDAVRAECAELLRLGRKLSEKVTSVDPSLQAWQAAVSALSAADFPPWTAEAELDRLVLALRRICLGVAHATSDRMLRSPRDRDRAVAPDGEEIAFGYERDLRPDFLEARCADYAGAPRGWVGEHLLFSSGQAALNGLLLALSPRSANPANPPRIRHLGGYFETEELLAMLAQHGMARELPKDGDEPADVLIVEPVYFDRAAQSHAIDVRAALARHIERAAGAPSLVIIDSTLTEPLCDIGRWLPAKVGTNTAGQLIANLRSGLKLHQVGLELANVGIVSLYRPEGITLESDPAEKLRKARTLTGAGLGLDAMAALDAPWFLDRETARFYADAVFANNALLAERVAEIDGLFSLISHPALGASNDNPPNGNACAAPYCLLQLHEDSPENYRLLEAIIAREAKARNLRLDKGGSFGFRSHRYEAILPQAGEITPFLRVAMGARGGWSRDGIVDLFREIARAPSLDAL